MQIVMNTSKMTNRKHINKHRNFNLFPKGHTGGEKIKWSRMTLSLRILHFPITPVAHTHVTHNYCLHPWDNEEQTNNDENKKSIFI